MFPSGIPIYNQATNPELFPSYNWTIVRLGDMSLLGGSGECYQVTITGTVIVNFCGDSQNWKRQTIGVAVSVPHFLPPGKCLRFMQAAPFATINAIYDQDYANNGGWAVDSWGLPIPKYITNGIGFTVDLANRDSDAWTFRLGYMITFVGEVASSPGPD